MMALRGVRSSLLVWARKVHWALFTADGLLGRDVEYVFGGLVHRLDDAVLVEGEDALGGGAEDGADACLALLQFLAAGGDLPDHALEGAGQHADLAAVVDREGLLVV